MLALAPGLDEPPLSEGMPVDWRAVDAKVYGMRLQAWISLVG